MFNIRDSDYQKKLILGRNYGACPSDNDGVHLNSEPFIQKCILKAVARILELNSLTDNQTKLVRSTFGQPDNIMSMDLFDKLSRDPELGQSQILQQYTKESFVPFFVEARANVWQEWTSKGLIELKPGAEDYLNEFRGSGAELRLLGLVTGMPYKLVEHSVNHVLRASDILPDNPDRRVCCDDPRLGGRGKPDPLCYELGMGHFAEQYDIRPGDMWTVEDRANGAVAALKALVRGEKIGIVVVIPDANDVNPVAEWDKKGLMLNHLQQNPEDRKRLVFLRSLSDISFS